MPTNFFFNLYLFALLIICGFQLIQLKFNLFVFDYSESCIRNQVKKELVFDCDNGTPKEKFPRADLGMTKLDLNQKLASDE